MCLSKEDQTCIIYSKILVEDKDAKGFSISLPPEKGGVEYKFKHDNYKIYYKDILEQRIVVYQPFFNNYP